MAKLHPPLSERCGLLGDEGATPRTSADCPKDAVYIKTVNTGSNLTIPGDTPFPIMFEGGEGDDKVVVVGTGSQQVLVNGGAGNDSMTVIDPWAQLLTRLGPYPLVGGAIVLMFLALVGWIARRALTTDLKGTD